MSSGRAAASDCGSGVSEVRLRATSAAHDEKKASAREQIEDQPTLIVKTLTLASELNLGSFELP